MCQRQEMTLYNNCRELIVICLVTVQQLLLVVDSASEGLGTDDPHTHINPWSVPLKWLKIHWYVLLMVGVVVSALVGVSLGMTCLICCRRGQRSHNGKDDIELEELLPREKTRPLISIRKKSKEKQEDERTARENSAMAVDSILKNTGLFQMKQHLPDMGSRMQKYWFQVSTSEGQSLILTISPISRHCPLLPLEEKTVKTLNELMKELQAHPFLQPVEYIHYLSDRKQVIIVQPFREQGSLKDLIYNVKPDWSWSDKYPESRKQFRPKAGLPPGNVALYGRQILEAMMFLLEKFSLNAPLFVLDHLQSGNIFVQDGVCRVGGYENTLLGYRSRFYRMCKDHLEHMDVIMFGHLVFEMSCGYELTTLFPTDQDYQAVKDDSVEDVLYFTFGHQKAREFKLNMATVLMLVLFCLNQLVIGFTHFSNVATVVMVIETILLLIFHAVRTWSKRRSHDIPQPKEVKVHFPKIHEVKEHPFFKHVPVPQLDKSDRSKMMLTSDLKELLLKVEMQFSQ